MSLFYVKVPLMHLHTYLLTTCSRVLLEKLPSSQLVKKFPAFYGTRRFITPFTSSRHLSLSWGSSIQSILLSAAVREPALYEVLIFQVPNLVSLFRCLVRTRVIRQGPRLFLQMTHNRIRFYGEELLTSSPTPKLEDHPLSAVRDCLFNVFAATHNTRGLSSIRNSKTRHTVVSGTHLLHMGLMN
jgi:hypothetical protein